jgi:hypothetical protein
MKTVVGCILSLITYSMLAAGVYSQQDQSMLVNRMKQHENDIVNTYLEYQKLYYEDKARVSELHAFEDLLTVYINQVSEIYETLNLSEKKMQTPRDIAARALIFKALMYLEKAPLNPEYFEKACYEYYEALNLYNGVDDPPVIFKDLPQTIQSGDKIYYRLMDILDDKGKGLFDFGKVVISFRNFRVTANFDPQMIELIKVEDAQTPKTPNTYRLASPRIVHAFDEVFRRAREVETYVALPQGTYILRLNNPTTNNNAYTPLTRFYVSANQEQFHILEPLADWIILYENPTSKRPDFYKFRRTSQSGNSPNATNNIGFPSQTNGSSHKNPSSPPSGANTHEQLVAEIVSVYLPQFDIKLMFDLNDPNISANAIQIISRAVVEYVESRAFYNEWNLWTASWDISKKVREIISPGSFIPIELVELIYKVLREL